MVEITVREDIPSFRPPNTLSTTTETIHSNFSENFLELELIYEEIQKKTFTKWINSQLKSEKDRIYSIDVDLGDGKCLLKLSEALSKQTLPKVEELSARKQRQSNIKTALQFLEQTLGESLSNFNSEDIVEGKTSLILELIWLLILRFQIQQIHQESKNFAQPRSQGLTEDVKKVKGKNETFNEIDTKDMLLIWVQNQLSIYGESAPLVKDFHQSWKNGAAFSALVNRHDPRLIAHPELVKVRIEKGQEEWKHILNDAFLAAKEKMGIPLLLDVDDILCVQLPDEKSILTYVSELYKVMSKSQKNEASSQTIEIVRNELDIKREQKKQKLKVKEALAAGDRLITKIQKLFNTLPVIFDLETELDRITLGGYWVSLTSFEKTATELVNEVHAYTIAVEKLIKENEALPMSSKCHLEDKMTKVLTKHQDLCRESSNLSHTCKALQQILDKNEEINVFERAIEELTNDVNKLMAMRLADTPKKERSSLLATINHDLDELEQSVLLISNEMPILSPKYLLAAKEALRKSLMSTKTIITEENLQFELDKSKEDFLSRLNEVTIKLEEGANNITGVESVLLSYVFDFGKYKTALSEQKALIKSSYNALKVIQSELLALDANASLIIGRIKAQLVTDEISNKMKIVQSLTRKWQDQLEELTIETQKFEELFKYLQIEKLMRSKLISIQSEIGSWDEGIANHIMTQTGDGLCLLRKKFEDMTSFYSKSNDIPFAQECHNKLHKLLKESEDFYEQRYGELSNIGTPTRWQDTAKDIESMLEKLRSTLSSRILTHGLSCTQQQLNGLQQEVLQLDEDITTFRKVTWTPFEAQTTERLDKSSPDIRIIIENIHQVLLGSWIEVQESLERRKKQIRMISRGFEFRRYANEIGIKMSDISLLTKKIVDHEELRNEAEVHLDTFKREIEHLSLEFEELFDSEDNVYFRRLTELEDTYESTRSYLIESLRENNSKVWWHQAEAAKDFISALEELCYSVSAKLSELVSKSHIEAFMQKITEGISDLSHFQKNELLLLADIKTSLDALPDEEKPEDVDKIASNFETIRFDISNVDEKLQYNAKLLSVIQKVFPFEDDLRNLSTELSAKNEEALQLLSEAKWSPELTNVSRLQTKYLTLDQQLIQIRKKYLLPLSHSITSIVDLLQDFTHPSLIEKKKDILRRHDKSLRQYNNLNDTLEKVTLTMKQTVSIAKAMDFAKIMEYSTDEVKDIVGKLTVYLEEGSATVAARLSMLQEDLQELRVKVHIIPEMEIFLAGGDPSKSNLDGLRAAISRYEDLAQSIHSTSEEFLKKKDTLCRYKICNEHMEIYQRLVNWISEKKQELNLEVKFNNITALNSQYDSVLLINSAISAQESSYLSLNALCTKYKESIKGSDTLDELQTMLSYTRQIDISWNDLKKLATDTSTKLQSALMYARFIEATQNLFSTSSIIYNEIESANPIVTANDTVLKWREKLEKVEKDTSSTYAAACEHCLSEHRNLLQAEFEATKDVLNQRKAQLAMFLSSIKSSRLLAVYLDDARELNTILLNYYQETANSRRAYNIINGKSRQDDELQLDRYTHTYLSLETTLQVYTARYDNLREYYFTILAQSPGAAAKINQIQSRSESEWTRLLGMLDGMKKETELLHLHIKWHQQLREVELVLDAAECRIQKIDDMTWADLQQEIERLEEEQEKIQSSLDFTGHPHWTSLLRKPHHNILILKQHYSSVQTRLDKLDIAPYNLRNAFARSILESLRQQTDIVRCKIDIIKTGNDPNLNIGDELKKVQFAFTNFYMEKLRILDTLFTASNDLDEKYQHLRNDTEFHVKTLLTILDELRSKFERVQEFHKLVDEIDNALGVSLDLIEQNPEEETALSISKQLKSSFNSLLKQIPQEIEKAISLVEGLDDWGVLERLQILPDQWEEMKILITRRLHELSELAKRKGLRSSSTSPAGGSFLPRSRSTSPHITWNFKLADPKSTWRPTSPVTSSYMRPTLASLSRISAVNSSFKSLRRPLGNSTALSPSPSPQERLDAQYPFPSVPSRLIPSSPNAYIPDPKDPLDLEVGRVVNSCPIGITVTKVNETGHYWIGEAYPKLCYLRLLVSKMVMVRVGGGWAELSRCLAEHYSFERRFIAISTEWATLEKNTVVENNDKETRSITPNPPALNQQQWNSNPSLC